MRRAINTAILAVAVTLLFAWFVVEAIWQTTIGPERHSSRIRWRDLAHGVLTVEARDAE